MKRKWAWIFAATFLGALGSTPTTFASTVHYPTKQDKIVLNGTVINTPYGIVVNNTTYMPIWYVMQGLKSVGVQSTWDGHTWKLETKSKTDLSNINAGHGTMAISLNGTLIQNVSGIDYLDPASGKTTTYMPIWYVQQILSRLGISQNWNGTEWTLNDKQGTMYTLPAPQIETPGNGTSIVFDNESDQLNKYIPNGYTISQFRVTVDGVTVQSTLDQAAAYAAGTGDSSNGWGISPDGKLITFDVGTNSYWLGQIGQVQFVVTSTDGTKTKTLTSPPFRI